MKLHGVTYLMTGVVLPQDATTPLILAAASGHVDCVKELLEQGSDPRARRVVSTRVNPGPVQFTHCFVSNNFCFQRSLRPTLVSTQAWTPWFWVQVLHIVIVHYCCGQSLCLKWIWNTERVPISTRAAVVQVLTVDNEVICRADHSATAIYRLNYWWHRTR
jgi:hypothetical protein